MRHENFSVFKINFFVKDKKLLENTFFYNSPINTGCRDIEKNDI
jgi:hypothetical protein